MRPERVLGDLEIDENTPGALGVGQKVQLTLPGDVRFTASPLSCRSR